MQQGGRGQRKEERASRSVEGLGHAGVSLGIASLGWAHQNGAADRFRRTAKRLRVTGLASRVAGSSLKGQGRALRPV